MRNGAITKRAAIAATGGFAGLGVFQLLIAAGAPVGEAAWGGATEGRLSPGLRVGSAISVVVYAVAAALILRRAGVGMHWLSHTAGRIGSWVLVVLLTLGTLANFLSQSPWERFLLAPVTLVLAALCLVVASSTAEHAVGDAAGGLALRRGSRRTSSKSAGESR